MANCEVDGCVQRTNREGYSLCYQHWKAEKDGLLSRCNDCGVFKEGEKPLCSACYRKKQGTNRVGHKAIGATQIGDSFGISAQKVNSLLAELGWISKHIKGWLVTPQGARQGGVQREHPQTGVPYVAWPEDIVTNRVLRRAAAEIGANVPLDEKSAAPQPVDAPSSELSFRERFPATFRASDGHMVRSRAELIIDNWLYSAGILHAYERRLPIEEEVYCDFYINSGDKPYIEFWGIEEDEKYAARKLKKQEIYKKHELNLIELNSKDLENIDDVLPKRLLHFKIGS